MTNCPGLPRTQGFSGHRTFSAKTRTILGKLGQGVCSKCEAERDFLKKTQKAKT